MSIRFVIRKDSKDAEYPWTLRDATCPVSDKHTFAADDFTDHTCNGNCDAFGTFDAAVFFMGLVRP